MGEGNLSSMQSMLKRRTSPELFAAMERESRLWKAECPNCRADTPFWELGGVRYKAAGEPKKRMRCPQCGQTGWLRIHWTGGDVTALGPRPSVAPFIIKLTLVAMLIPLAIIGIVLFIVLR